MNSINNNLMALHTANTLNRHYSSLSTSVERLSTGLRINSAADDAAGLAIRELMRADVAALNQGQRNANDAISMLQTADAALGVIDEKLIRMKELAEQAATGTYDSTQRLMIDSEFQAMAAEIDRIARATDFNGLKLLDGSLSGAHNGGGLKATGAMKIHFGSANDSAEDYYYVDIADCTIKGLFGLKGGASAGAGTVPGGGNIDVSYDYGHIPLNSPEDGFYLNDISINDATPFKVPLNVVSNIQDLGFTQGEWYITPTWLGNTPSGVGTATENFIFRIPKGSKNLLINMAGCVSGSGDNDLEIFTADGLHLVGTPADDFVFNYPNGAGIEKKINAYKDYLGFDYSQYDDSILNTGPEDCDSETLKYTHYNGMTIGYTGDPERSLGSVPNDGNVDADTGDFEVMTLDEATEDLIVWLTGSAAALIQIYWDVPDSVFNNTGDGPANVPPPSQKDSALSIKTQSEAQAMLVDIDKAIVRKDEVRAHLGALQNRLENTISNLSIQSLNLQTSESRISDTNIATEMTDFVHHQVLTQSATAMLGQANSYPQMLMQLLG